MTNEIHRFLDDYGTQEMFNIFLEVSDSLIEERIVQKIDKDSDYQHMPSAAAMYRALKDILGGYNTPQERIDALKEYFNRVNLKAEKCENKSNLEIIKVTGKITSVKNPKENVLYFQRDNSNTNTWKMYAYSEEEIDGDHWICVGDTKNDLIGYFKKDQIDELKEYLGIDDNIEYIPLTSEYINGRVNVIFNKYKPE